MGSSPGKLTSIPELSLQGSHDACGSMWSLQTGGMNGPETRAEELLVTELSEDSLRAVLDELLSAIERHL